MQHNFNWQPRYSDTNEPDKQGRWSRLCYCNEILIAWINRVEYGGQIVFSVTDYFPSNGNSNPCYSGICDNLEDAKDGVEKRFEEVMVKLNF